MSLHGLGNISLNAKQGSILNCLGIQPIFIEDGVVKDSFLGFVYRLANVLKRQGHMKYMCKYYDDETNIIKKSFHINSAKQEIVNFLLKNSFTLKHNGSLDSLMNNKDLLKQTLLFYLHRIQYYINIGKGNFIITSRTDLYNTKLFTANQVSGFQIYLVDESILPRNVLILGHRNNVSFCNPYIACPLINKQDFNRVCRLNGIDIDRWKLDFTKELPLLVKYVNLYSLYQSYLDNVEVQYWYIEQFKNPTFTRQKAYYTTLYFD